MEQFQVVMARLRKAAQEHGISDKLLEKNESDVTLAGVYDLARRCGLSGMELFADET